MFDERGEMPGRIGDRRLARRVGDQICGNEIMEVSIIEDLNCRWKIFSANLEADRNTCRRKSRFSPMHSADSRR